MMKVTNFMLGLFLCVGIGLVLTSCRKDEEENRSMLVGTWSETNNLYSVTLTLDEDGKFEFNTGNYAKRLNGSGTYKYWQNNAGLGFYGMEEKVKTDMYLLLNYTSKEPLTFDIMELTSSRLTIRNSERFYFKLTK